MNEQEQGLPLVLVSPEMTDVLQELAHEKGVDLPTLMRQHRIIMAQLSIEASKE